MKAVVQTGKVDGEKYPHGDISVFKVTEVDKPSDPASDEVLIKVHAASLNPVDLKRSIMPVENEVDTPIVGYDVAGTVEAVGSDVDGFSKGDRVFGDVLLNSLGPKKSGSLAEYTLAPACALAKIPAHVSFSDAAALPVVALTGIQALRAAGAKDGHRLFITAGSGGVGLHTAQIAKACFGASQVAVTASRTSEVLVKKYGADVVVDYKTQDATEVLPNWADVVVDATGEQEMEKKVAKSDAGLVSIVSPSDEAFQFVVCEPCEKDMATIAELLDEGKLIPVIDTVFGFDDVEKALQHEMAGHAKGKIVVKIVDE